MLVSGPVAQEKQGIWVISVIGATLKKMRDDAYDASLSHDGIADRVSRFGQARHLADERRRRAGQTPDQAGRGLPSVLAHVVSQRQSYFVREVPRSRTARPRLAIESRDLKGGDPVVLLSNPRLTDFTWGQSGRLIYSVRELPPNHYDSNLWELRFDDETGKPKGHSATSYRLDRILLWQSGIDCRRKTFRLSERPSAKRCLSRLSWRTAEPN